MQARPVGCSSGDCDLTWHGRAWCCRDVAASRCAEQIVACALQSGRCIVHVWHHDGTEQGLLYASQTGRTGRAQGRARVNTEQSAHGRMKALSWCGEQNAGLRNAASSLAALLHCRLEVCCEGGKRRQLSGPRPSPGTRRIIYSRPVAAQAEHSAPTLIARRGCDQPCRGQH